MIVIIILEVIVRAAPGLVRSFVGSTGGGFVRPQECSLLRHDKPQAFGLQGGGSAATAIGPDCTCIVA